MFNLKKHAKGKITPSESALEDHRENLTKVTPSYNAMLDSVRKDKEKTVSIEGELKAVHVDEKYLDTVEARLDSDKVGDDYPHRTGKDHFDQLPINLLGEIADQKKADAFRNSVVKDEDTEFWDTLLSSKDVKKTPSQLHNHPSRFRNLTEDSLFDNSGVRDMVMASLVDADAMLYHIYRSASSEGRELNEEESGLVNKISINKANILEKLVK